MSFQARWSCIPTSVPIATHEMGNMQTKRKETSADAECGDLSAMWLNTLCVFLTFKRVWWRHALPVRNAWWTKEKMTSVLLWKGVETGLGEHAAVPSGFGWLQQVQCVDSCCLCIGGGEGWGPKRICLSKSVCIHWLACWLAFSRRRPLCWRRVMGKGWRGAMQTRVECWFKATSRQEESELAFTWESVFGMWEREWTSFL